MKKLVIANWKMNPINLKGAVKMVEELKRGVAKKSKSEIVICPPFVYLANLAKLLKGSKIKLGAQNCSWDKMGPLTGEIAPTMLKDIGAKYVILGHSERMEKLAENNAIVSRKLKTALEVGLNCVVCIGDNADEHNSGKVFAILEQKFNEILADLKGADYAKIILVYEPIWAISTNQDFVESCSVDEALTVALFFKKLLIQRAGQKSAGMVKILYGGSVNAQNANSYLAEEGIDGVLVGGASLNIKEFLKIC
ncbi:MAG: triose-phosphate isomerase [Candidatus Gribaldobacteria bacterium]|nr:triose-phosphate isomerase [Candidatus Gribaldobacteria bacterium]